MKNKEYKLKSNLTKEQLITCGFNKVYSGYVYHKYLYKKFISLSIRISNEMELEFLTVDDEMLHHSYTPFYNDRYQVNNLVLEDVRKKYNSTMNGLVKKGIFKNDNSKRK